jgi:hypothetical protein
MTDTDDAGRDVRAMPPAKTTGKGSGHFQDVQTPQLGLPHQRVYQLLEPVLNLDFRRACSVDVALRRMMLVLWPSRNCTMELAGQIITCVAPVRTGKADDAPSDLRLLRKVLKGHVRARDCEKPVLRLTASEADRMNELLARRPIRFVLSTTEATQAALKVVFTMEQDEPYPCHMEQLAIDTCASAVAIVAIAGKTEIVKCRCGDLFLTHYSAKEQCGRCRRDQQRERQSKRN